MADGQTVGESPPRGKSILLFSDGTGNSSGKLFKTNVWRTYEAADLGPPPPGLRPQIAFYDDGVGTSSFRPLAILGGVFGFGLKRNVLDLYRFACRNYAPGDTIYAFGFSRGAFTIRLAIALIASQGLVPADTEAALQRGTADAWRAYRRRYLPRRLQWPTRAWRALRSALIHALRRPEDRYHLRRNRQPEIRFVGVWDTVAAYGGPSVEITRAIDDWFFPLSMPNYALSKRVGRARHALSLDDERDAFQPLVWDELAERELIRRGLVDADRLRQFWFTGMHADVGGGYPDESLSYVSLLWMLEEAQAAGLRTLDVITDRHRALANSAGPIHDSRAGLNNYYRYLPRRIDALLDPPAPETRLAWPPERVRAGGNGRGLLTAARIHESALARIVRGTDRYAPITIPETFEIHPPQRAGENAPQPASGAQAPTVAPDTIVSLLSPAERALLHDPARNAARAAMMPAVWDMVWWRRVAYFATVLVTAALVSMPLWPAPPGMERWCEDSRCLLPGLFSPLKAVLPGAATPWIDRYTTQPVMASALLLLLAALTIVGGRLGGTIRARSAAAWDCVLRGTVPQPPRAGVARAIRRSALWLGTSHFVKWRILPALAALAVLLAIVAIPLALPMQWWLATAERDGTLCADPGTHNGDAGGAPIAFMADRACTDLRQTLTPRLPYTVTLRVTRQWCDGRLPADPVRGVSGGWWLSPLRFHRRVTSANWLKPLAVVRRPDAEDARTPGAKVRIDPLDFDYVGDGVYRARFVAPAQGGRLYMALNDAAPPFRPDLFYANNSGAAIVTVAEENTPSCRDDGCAIAQPPPPTGTCGAPVVR